ncbi:hypothetical protein [Alteromonas stellipolaris]|uniref:Uncharacterized protein n=1 Tax=Alteromonas stellipolaris TaxID=233316 RepID=A0ABN4LWA8_9ALTE|nr:hypothetical protein AVL57_00425 [Alteromonas stellipolaris]
MITDLAEQALMDTTSATLEPEFEPQSACLTATNIYFPLLRAVFRSTADDPIPLLKEALGKIRELDENLLLQHEADVTNKNDLILFAVTEAIEHSNEQWLDARVLSELVTLVEPVNVSTNTHTPHTKSGALLKIAIHLPNEHRKKGIAAAEKIINLCIQKLKNSDLNHAHEMACTQTILAELPVMLINALRSHSGGDFQTVFEGVELDVLNTITAILVDCDL